MARIEIVLCPHSTNGFFSCRDCGEKGQISDGSFGTRQVARPVMEEGHYFATSACEQAKLKGLLRWKNKKPQ